MSDNNLAIKITADITDMQVKYAVARAEVNALSAEMNKLAKASVAGTIDAGGSARLQQLAGDLLRARSAAGGYASGLQEAGFALGGFNQKMESGHGSIATATREFRALFDELSSGRTRQTPGTLAILATRVFGLGPAALLSVGGVAALAAGLAYLGYRALEAKKSLDQAAVGAAFAGNLDVTRQELQTLAEQMAQASNVSSTESRKIVAAFASMHDMSVDEINALSGVVSQFATVTGQDADKASESLVKMFGTKESAAELAKSLGGISQAQLNAASTADRGGNAGEIFAAKLDLLNGALARARGAEESHNTSMFASIKNMFMYSGAIQAGLTAQQLQADLTKEETVAAQKQADTLKFLANQIRATPATPQQTLQTGVAVAEKENPVALQIQEAKSKVSELTAALVVAKQQGDQISIDKLNAGLVKTQEDLSNLQFGPALERMRTDMAQLASTWDGTQSGLLAKQIQVAQGTLASAQKNSKEYLDIQHQIATLEVQERQAAGTEIIAQTRAQISEIGADSAAGVAQRLQQESAAWSQLLAGDKLTAAQRLEAQRSLSQSEAELTRQMISESQAIKRQDVSTDIAIARLTLEAKRSELEAEVGATAEAAANKYAILRDLTAKELDLDEQERQGQLEALKDQPVQYDQVMNEIKELKAKNVLDLAVLDKQAAAAAQKAAKDQATSWKSAVNEIEGAEGTLVGNLISRRQSLSASLLQITSNMLQQEIANDIKAVTTRLLLHEKDIATQKALEQGGYLYHAVIEALKSANTAHQQGAQTAAVTAGNTARNASTAAAAATGQAVQASTGASAVMSDAARAFAGAYAAMVGIPYVGPIIAPGAAAEAFAAVSAMAPLASLDVGAYDLPHDMRAQLHAGEAVLSKPEARAWRQEVESGGGRGDGGDTHHHWNINAVDGKSVERLLNDPGNRRKFSAMVRSR